MIPLLSFLVGLAWAGGAGGDGHFDAGDGRRADELPTELVLAHSIPRRQSDHRSARACCSVAGANKCAAATKSAAASQRVFPRVAELAGWRSQPAGAEVYVHSKCQRD